MADRVGREEGWQAAEREAGGVGDSYNAADEAGGWGLWPVERAGAHILLKESQS